MFEVKRVIVGQDRMIERMFVALLARGHCLLEGVPGVAKTLAVETLATVVGGTFARIQFTPDLVPADIVGTRIYRQSSEKFDVELGPVFVNFLLADEINRAPAKVQSALLEVMAEQQVSIGGETHEVPDPFLVMATQNPIEQEGVYPLPEAQRDRFLMKILVGYPTDAEEREIVYRMGVSPPEPQPSSPRPTCSPCSAAPTRCSCTTRWSTTRSGWCWPPARRPSTACRRRPADPVRRQPARLARHRPGHPGAGPAARPRLRAAAGRAGHRAGHPAAPAGAQLRRARRRHPGRPHRRPDHGSGADAVGGVPAGRRAERPPPPATGPASRASPRVDRAARAPTRQRTVAGPAVTRHGRRGRGGVGRHGPRRGRAVPAAAAGHPQARRPAPGRLRRPAARARAARRASRRSTGPATTCAGWTGRSPPAPRVPHVRRTVADRELETWMAIDLSASLDFGTARCSSATW